jgi:UDP-glucose 4-epimerase
MIQQHPVFITGGSGFIGTAVVRRLQAEGRPCIVLDKVEPRDPQVAYRAVDVCDLGRCVQVLQGGRHVIHLAGLVAQEANANPFRAIAVNVQGTANVLEACVQCGVERVVLASTFFVYEDCERSVVDEETKLDATIMGPFARSKFFTEQIAHDYRSRHRLSYAALRLGSVYGPGNGSNVVCGFVGQALRGEVIAVWGEGRRHRQFIHVDDVVDGVLRALAESACGTFNLAGEESTTTRQVLEIIREQLPQTKVVFDPSKPEKLQAYTINLGRSKEELGWVPRIAMTEGIRRTIAAMCPAGAAVLPGPEPVRPAVAAVQGV